MANIVYVLTNQAMPELVKIGRTSDSVESRLGSLNNTSVPYPFECHFAAEVSDSSKLEKTLHQLFAEHRVNPKREFFRIQPEKVVLAISIGTFQEVTPGKVSVDPDDEQALEKEKERLSKISLESLGIPIGSVLNFSRDEGIQATVVQGNKVSLQGEIHSLSSAALKSLHALGYKWSTANGSEYWMYDGELLKERRERLETEQFGQTV